jgi:hypothetical protein
MGYIFRVGEEFDCGCPGEQQCKSRWECTWGECWDAMEEDVSLYRQRLDLLWLGAQYQCDYLPIAVADPICSHPYTSVHEHGGYGVEGLSYYTYSKRQEIDDENSLELCVAGSSDCIQVAEAALTLISEAVPVTEAVLYLSITAVCSLFLPPLLVAAGAIIPEHRKFDLLVNIVDGYSHAPMHMLPFLVRHFAFPQFTPEEEVAIIRPCLTIIANSMAVEGFGNYYYFDKRRLLSYVRSFTLLLRAVITSPVTQLGNEELVQKHPQILEHLRVGFRDDAWERRRSALATHCSYWTNY